MVSLSPYNRSRNFRRSFLCQFKNSTSFRSYFRGLKSRGFSYLLKIAIKWLCFLHHRILKMLWNPRVLNSQETTYQSRRSTEQKYSYKLSSQKRHQPKRHPRISLCKSRLNFGLPLLPIPGKASSSHSINDTGFLLGLATRPIILTNSQSQGAKRKKLILWSICH